MDEPLEILVLDDEPIVCTRIKPSLEKAGYQVEIMTDSVRALDRIREKRFDILITDYRMSKVTGLDLLNLQKQIWPDTKVIIISGYATLEVARKALQSGVYDFMAKPFRLYELKEVVERAAQTIRAARQSQRPET
jgi:DNA-binding NtrC family response regulator